MDAEPAMRLLSLGAGRQSTALFLLGCEGKMLPKLDAAIFADTQWEPRHVMTHLANLQQFGEEHGVPVYLASKGSLPKDVLNRQVFATIPAWTRSKPYRLVPIEFGPCRACEGVTSEDSDGLFGDGDCPDCEGSSLVPVRWDKRLQVPSDGRIKRQCTSKYKIEIINSQVRLLLGAEAYEQECRYCAGSGERIAPWDPEAGIGPCSICRGDGIRRRVGKVPSGAVAEQWIGFTTDEFDRVTDVGFPRYQRPRFPLIDLNWSVDDCERLNTERGWQSEKSACKGCPLHEDEIWIDMKRRTPDEFAEVVAFDSALRAEGNGMTDDRFLHESRQPLGVAVARAEARMQARGVQDQMWGEPLRKKVRGCSPYGCRAGEQAA